MKNTELTIVTIVSIVLGTSMHFAHHLPVFNTFMQCIFPSSECVWEHMKMLFYPMLITALYLTCRQKNIQAFGGMIAASLLAIPVQIALFYSYYIFVHHSVPVVDVIAYVVVMIFAYIMGNRFTANKWIRNHWGLFVALAVVTIALLAVLTFYHPEINIFIPEEE